MRKAITTLFLAVCALGFCLGCASPGAPLPPSLNLPRPVNDLSATRKGDRVVLTWGPPVSTTDRGPIRRPTITRVCRLVNRFPMSTCETVVKELRASDLPSNAPGAKNPKVSVEGAIPRDLLNANNEATYAIEVLNDRGRSAGLSNQVIVSLAPALPPPSNVNGTVGPQGVTISFNAVPANSILPRQWVTYGYKLWRRPAGNGEYIEIESTPLGSAEQHIADPSFEWEQTYDYKVTGETTVTVPGKLPVVIDGDDSQVVRVFVHDVFPPHAPTGLQAVFSSVGQRPFVDLTWDPNMEPDLAGYDVYRKPKGQPEQKLNNELLRAPSFRDENVAPGETYTYSVDAVDLRGNRSPRSTESTENVPK
ncbi:MAG TPA: hypothetical protein VMU24_13205 [Candidatus Acidoferrales bacterium]|nr:hypothetical protein [Candidatus Acidoferrales bacterium]